MAPEGSKLVNQFQIQFVENPNIFLLKNSWIQIMDKTAY